MTKHKGGNVIWQGKRSSIREASPDDPIYTRGYVVGGNYTKSSPKSTAPKSNIRSLLDKQTDKEMKDWADSGMAEAARAQMSADSPSEKTEQLDSSTGDKGKD